MKIHLSLVVSLLVLFGAISPASAAQKLYFTPFVGIFEIKKEHKKVYGGAEIDWYGWNQFIVPKIGAYVTSKQSTYEYVGFNIDIPVLDTGLSILPGFAAGLYQKNKHKGKDLGGPIEFQSTIGFSFTTKKDFKFGANFSHISNAGIYKRNPGTEYASLFLSIPMSF